MAGGMMRFGIPSLPAAARRARRRGPADPRMGVELELNRKVTNVEEAMREGGFDAAFLAVGAHIGKRAYIPAGEAARILDAVSLLECDGGRGEAAARPPGGRLRRRQHGDGRGPHREAARCHRRGGRLPTHPRADARARVRGRGGRGGGRDDALARDHQAGRRRQGDGREDGARRDRLPPADRRARGARGRLGDPRPRARRRTSRCSTTSRGSRWRTASSRSART